MRVRRDQWSFAVSFPVYTLGQPVRLLAGLDNPARRQVDDPWAGAASHPVSFELPRRDAVPETLADPGRRHPALAARLWITRAAGVARPTGSPVVGEDPGHPESYDHSSSGLQSARRPPVGSDVNRR